MGGRITFDLESGVTDPPERYTITRTLINFGWAPDVSVGNPGVGTYGLHAGIGVFNRAATSSGELPDPAVDDYDWLYHEGFAAPWYSLSDGSISRQPLFFKVDLGGQRKVRGDFQYPALTLTGVGTGTGVTFSVFARLLLRV